MRDTAKTLDQLVGYLTQNKDQAIKEILLNSHPAFARLRKVAGVQYRIFFSTRAEMGAWLRARNFTEVDREEWDDEGHEEWLSTQIRKVPNSTNTTREFLKISTRIF